MVLALLGRAAVSSHFWCPVSGAGVVVENRQFWPKGGEGGEGCDAVGEGGDAGVGSGDGGSESNELGLCLADACHDGGGQVAGVVLDPIHNEPILEVSQWEDTMGVVCSVPE